MKRTTEDQKTTRAFSDTLARLRSSKKHVAKIICGRRVSLRPGVYYVACAPMSCLGPKPVEPVTVSIMKRDDVFGPIAAEYVHNLTAKGAKEFLATFNNGRISFVGRKWTTA